MEELKKKLIEFQIVDKSKVLKVFNDFHHELFKLRTTEAKDRKNEIHIYKELELKQLIIENSLLIIENRFLTEELNNLKSNTAYIRDKDRSFNEIDKTPSNSCLIMLEPTVMFGDLIIPLTNARLNNFDNVKNNLSYIFDYLGSELLDESKKFSPEKIFTENSISLINGLLIKTGGKDLEEIFIEFYNEEYLTQYWDFNFEIHIDMSVEDFHENKNDEEEVANYISNNCKWKFLKNQLIIIPYSWGEMDELDGYDINPLLENSEYYLLEEIKNQIYNDVGIISENYDDRLTELITNYNWKINLVSFEFPNIKKLITRKKIIGYQ